MRHWIYSAAAKFLAALCSLLPRCCASRVFAAALQGIAVHFGLRVKLVKREILRYA